MESGLIGDGEDDEHNGIGLVEISIIFVMLGAFFLEIKSLDRVYCEHKNGSSHFKWRGIS